jgi:hypothetical protein
MTSDIISRQPKGIPVGGQFAATEHGEPAFTLASPPRDRSRFPHPDTRYPHPMGCWPEDVEDPKSIALGEEDGTVDEVPRHTLHPDPQNARTISQPSCTILMENGATLTVVQVGDPEGGNSEERFSGDWDHYLKGDSYARDQVIETAHETMAQADSQ